MLNFCDFIQVYVFTPNHHLKLWTPFVTDGETDGVIQMERRTV